MDIKSLFDSCIESNDFSEEDSNILESLLNIASPMDFTDDMISDDDLAILVTKMEHVDEKLLGLQRFNTLLVNLKPTRGNSNIFI